MPDLQIAEVLMLVDAADTEDLAQVRTAFSKTEAVDQKSDFFALVTGSQVHSTLSAEILLQPDTLYRHINTSLKC